MSRDLPAREPAGRPLVALLGDIGQRMMDAADLRGDATLFCTGELVQLIFLLDSKGLGVPEDIMYAASGLAYNWLLDEGGLR